MDPTLFTNANGAERAAKGERSEGSLAGCRGPRLSRKRLT